MKMIMSRRVLLSIGCILMISAVGLALATPVITSNTVHVKYASATYKPVLSVIQEGESIPMTLEAKHQNPSDPNGLWLPTSGGASGTLMYNTVGSTFDVSFTGTVPLPSTAYSLIYKADPFANTVGELLATGTSDSSGNLVIPTTPVSSPSLPDTSDANYLMGAKIWLVVSADYDSSTHLITSWNPDNYLFETALITYTQGTPLDNTVDLWATIPTPSPAPTLGSQIPAVTIHFWYSTDGMATWTEITGSPKTVTWGWYCGFAGTIQYTFTTDPTEVDFGVTYSAGATITITPSYPQT